MYYGIYGAFAVKNEWLGDWVWISEAIAYLIVILEIVTITVLDIKDAKINIDFDGNVLAATFHKKQWCLTQ